MKTSLPLYQQLSHKLRVALESGTFQMGQRFPSVRRTAQQHQLSLNTVMAAYRMLEDQGLIEARPQSGFYVKNRLPRIERAASPLSRQALAQPQNEVLSLIEINFAAQQNPEFTNLSLACPTDAMFYPKERLRRALTRELRAQPNLLSRYALPPGSFRLRQQIAQRMMSVGVVAEVDDVVISHGCLDAIHMALLSVTKPGDCVGLESPTYFYLIPLLAKLGLKVIEIPTHTKTGLSVEAVELLLEQQKIQAIICMPNLHNPLGCTMPLGAKKRLAQLVNKYEVPLIEDGLYAELQYEATQPAVQAFDEKGWVIFCSSFTKTLAPDFRIGWVHSPRFCSEIQKNKSLFSVAESELLCETIASYLEEGGYELHLRQLRHKYESNMNAVQALIATHFPAGTQATKPRGGFVFWVELPGEIDTTLLFKAMLKEKICLTPGVLYSPSGRFKKALRFSSCYPLERKYHYAVTRVGAVTCEWTGIAPT